MTHIIKWTCNRCDDGACELITEDPEAVPRECPLHHIASWVEGSQ